MTRIWTCVILLFSCTPLWSAEPALDYTVADPELKVVRLDQSPTDSFLGVRVDPLGRIFVGGRERLFVYEPDERGGYRPRVELYRFPPNSWIYDIEIRGADLYVMTVCALYRIPGGVTQRSELKPERLIWGVPNAHVHQCFHNLAWGPEGDLYFSMGDPVWYHGDFQRPDHWGYWTFFSQPEGTKTPYHGVGGVFRCRPDGSRFQVVARGTRNSCGLAFDRHWNLFTNDNDHESIPAAYVPGRLLHVTPGAYFSWPRGWMPAKQPNRFDLLETVCPDLGRFVPVGQAYYHDTFLPEKYRDNLLVARWCTRSLTRYPLQANGATFKADEKPFLVGQNNARPVGVCVGRGGRIFATIAHMAHNETSPTYASDLVLITRKDDPAALPFKSIDTAKATADQLWSELADPSWSRRQVAHQEILQRPDLLKEAGSRVSKTAADSPARLHLLWLAAAGGQVDPAAEQPDMESRIQAMRLLPEYGKRDDTLLPFIGVALQSPDARLRHAALLACFAIPKLPDAKLIVPLACSTDTYLRQTAAFLLAEKATLEQLEQVCRAPQGAIRLAGVLAVGFRLTIPRATKELPADAPLQPLRSEESWFPVFPEGKVDLRTLGRVGVYTMAEHWKVLKPTAEQRRLFGFLYDRLTDTDTRVRLQAAWFLAVLKDARTEPFVQRLWRENEEMRLAVAPVKPITRLLAVGPFRDRPGFGTIHAPERGPISFQQTYSDSDQSLTWQPLETTRYFDFASRFGPGVEGSCYAFVRLESATKQLAHLLLGTDDAIKVWHNGTEVFSNLVTRDALPLQDVVPLQLLPGGNDILLRVRKRPGTTRLYVHFRSLNPVVPQLPEKDEGNLLQERVRAGESQVSLSPEFQRTDWARAIRTGDASTGRTYFRVLGCMKCHSVAADQQVAGGPSLAEARKRFTPAYLAEAILLPNKQVSPLYQATVIATNQDQIVTGLVLNETDEAVEFLLSDATRKVIPKKQIRERKLSELSPMPSGLVKTPRELRDLLTYLLSERPTPP